MPSSGIQPQPQPRRPGGSSLHGRYGSDRDLSRPAPQRLTTVGRQGGSKPIPALRQNQLLERSPHELPVKDTDQPSAVYDIVSAPRKFFSVSNSMEQAVLDEKLIVLWSRNLQPFVELEGSFPYLQEHAT